MKAVTQSKYGSPDVLQLKHVETPTPADGQVLIKVRATTVTAADTMIRRGVPRFGRLFLGLRRPKHSVPGTCFAGEIEAVGTGVTQWRAGDQVFGEPGMNFGAHAEYVCMSEEGLLHRLPTNMTFEQAAPICDGALTSFNFLTNIATVQPGQKVLINGAAGSLGTAAIQLAHHFGANVTGVCRATHFDLVQSLGADHVIDYTEKDFTRTGDRYDIIFDTVGKRSFGQGRRALTPNGVYLSPVLKLPLLFQMMWTAKFSRRKARFSATGLLPVPKLRGMLDELVAIIEADSLKTVIDRRYTLDQIADAHRHVDTGRKTGCVVIPISSAGTG